MFYWSKDDVTFSGQVKREGRRAVSWSKIRISTGWSDGNDSYADGIDDGMYGAAPPQGKRKSLRRVSGSNSRHFGKI